MNLLDLILLLLMLAAAVSGARLGLVARLASWIGLGIGIWLSLQLVPPAVSFVEPADATGRFIVGVVVVVLVVGLTVGIADAVGRRARQAVARSPGASLDRILGASAGIVTVLVLVWLLIPAAAEVPGGIARQFRSSAIVDVVRGTAPQPPDTVRALRALIEQSRFPEVFADLRPAPEIGDPPRELTLDAATLERVTASTVNVETTGCGARFDGSGFAVEPDTIVTNAHVVAGAETVQVRRPDGSTLPARVVTFDDDRDLAVLAVPNLGQQPLPLAATSEGVAGAIVGYPGGQDEPRAIAAEVRQIRTAVGRDIYGRDRVERQVGFTAAAARQGDSGAPMADADGAVVGVVFAIAPDRPDLTYTLTTEEVRAVLAQPRNGSVGPCIR